MARILILDDERSIRITLVAFLKGAGYEVVEAPTVAEAEAMISQAEVDVAVVDILIGRENGLDFARTALGQNPNMQIILITGEPEVNSARTAINLGVFDYLLKPVSKEHIIEAVRRAAEKKRQLDEYDTLQAEQAQYRETLEEEVSRRTRELAASETKYRRLIENLNDVIYDVDHNGIITYVSPVVYNVLGYRPSEVEGVRFDTLIHPDYLPMVQKSFEETLRGLRKTVEFLIRDRQGEYRSVRVSGHYVRGGNDEVLGIQGVLTDITDQQASVVALVASEEKYRTVVDQLDDALFLHDLNGYIKDVNRESVRRYGYSREELLSLRVKDLDPDAFERGDASEVWRRLNPGERATIEARHRRRDGRIFPVVVSISPLFYEGARHMIVLARDLSAESAPGSAGHEERVEDA